MKYQQINKIPLERVDSTNKYIQRKSGKLKLPVCIIADYQENGKGQGSNFWESEKGENLLFSIAYIPENLKAEQSFYISKFTSLAVVEGVSTCLQGCKIKWPNDIVINKKKLSGLLIENTISGDSVKRSIIGIGLNVNQENFPSFYPGPEATSMFLETGQKVEKDFILDEILYKLSYWSEILDEGDFERIDEYYYRYFLNFGEWKLFRQGNLRFTAMIKGVEISGHLLLQTQDGKNLKFGFKEIEFVEL